MRHDLLRVIREGNVEALRQYFSQGGGRRDRVNTELVDPVLLRPALHMAVVCRRSSAPVFEALLQLGARADLVDATGHDVFSLVCSSGRDDLLKSLLEHETRRSAEQARLLERKRGEVLVQEASEKADKLQRELDVVREERSTLKRKLDALQQDHDDLEVSYNNLLQSKKKK